MTQPETKKELVERLENEIEIEVLEKIKGFEGIWDADPVLLNFMMRRVLKDRIYQEAMKIYNEFWDEVSRRRIGDGCEKSFNKYGVRIKTGRWTITPEWSRRQIFGTKEKFNRTWKHIALPAGTLKHPKKSFSKAEPWELDLIMECEAKFAGIRKSCEHLKNMTRASRGALLLLGLGEVAPVDPNEPKPGLRIVNAREDEEA